MVVGFALELVVEIGAGAASRPMEVRKEFEDGSFETRNERHGQEIVKDRVNGVESTLSGL